MKVKLGEIATIKGGKRMPKGTNLQIKKNEHPYLRITDFDNGRFNMNSLKYVPQDVFQKISSYTISKNDIFLSIVGTIGLVALVNKELDGASLTENAVKIVPKSKVDNQYLAYYLQSFRGKSQIDALSVGSTQKKLPIKNIKKLEIELPKYSEQCSISHKLAILDKKIELNNEINANLDELMSEIFERYVTEANVFTTDSLSNIANYKNGLAMQRFRPNGADKGLPVLKIKELNQGFTDSSSDRCSSKISNDVIVKTGDIIFSWSGTLIVKIWTGTTCGLNQHLFKVTSDKYPKWFIYKWTEYYLRQFQSIAAGKATTMGHIKRSDLKQAEVKIPHKSEIDRLDKLISPIFKRYVNNILEINSLKELKNELLSKIF